MSGRDAFLNSILGKPHVFNGKGPDEFDCYHCTAYVQRHLWGREMPDVEVPDLNNMGRAAALKWMMEQIEGNPHRRFWVEKPHASVLTLPDGAIMLMAYGNRPIHVATWLKLERRVVNCEAPFGVMYLDDSVLRMPSGWRVFRYYEPAEVLRHAG